MFFLRKKIVLAVALAAIAGGGYFTYTKVNATPAPQVTQQQVAVTKGNLQLSVSSSGTIKPPRTADLSFRSSGLVQEIYVQTGDQVTKGQALAKLDTKPLDFSLRQSLISLQTATINLQSLTAGARPEDMASAQASLAVARQKQVNMEAQGDTAAIASSQASLMNAQTKLAQLRNPTAADVASAEATVLSARTNLQTAQTKLETLRNPTATDVSSAQASLVSAKSSLATAQENLRKLKQPELMDINSAQSSVKSAEVALSNAQNNLTNLRSGYNDTKIKLLIEAYVELIQARDKLTFDRSLNASADVLQADEGAVIVALRKVTAAEAEVDYPDANVKAQDYLVATTGVETATFSLQNAKIKLEQLLHPTQVDLDAADRSVVQAQANLTSAQAKYDQLRNPTAQDISTGENSVASAQASLTNAQAKLEQLKNPTANDIASAEAAVMQAQKNFEDTKVPYKEVDLMSQRASVQQAQASIEKLMNPSTALDLAKAQLSVDKAKLDVDQAQDNLDQAILVAPFNGIVSAVPVTAGASQGVGTNTVVMSIVDPSEMQVQVNIDETDVTKVDIGQTVLTTAEASGQPPYRGRVIAIAPNATVQSGIATYQVTVSITNPRGLRPGMSAVPSIVYQERQGVVLVVNRAIKTVGREKTVQVMVNGAAETRTIKVGLADDTRTEVLEGLSEGDQVIVESTARAPSTSTQGAGGALRGAGGIAVPGGAAPGGFGR